MHDGAPALPMKVLQLAPLWFPVARDAPGGRESFLARLVEALQTLGCRNTVLGSGDSRVEADVVAVTEEHVYARFTAGTACDYPYYEQHQLWLALGMLAEFDVVHSHLIPVAYALSALPGHGGKVLHTVHTAVHGDLEWMARLHPDVWTATVSEFQARRLWRQGARRCRVIHNGIDVESFTFSARGGEGLVFLGRIEPAKGPDIAIEVARRLRRRLTLAGPITDQGFYARAIAPHLDGDIRYVGVVDHERRGALLGEAGCALLPFRGDEAFGMVTIEAMACGTPVVALSRGAVPEIVEPDLTGYLTDREAELGDLVRQAMRLDRHAVRARVAARFDISIAAARYRHLFEEMLSER